MTTPQVIQCQGDNNTVLGRLGALIVKVARSEGEVDEATLQALSESIQEIVSHQMDIITESDWFAEMVSDVK